MKTNKPLCKLCGSPWHYQSFCLQKKTKRPRQRSDKQLDYETWLKEVARPALIVRDGNNCFCCHRPAHAKEKLDIEHTLNKGSHPELKRTLTNLTLYCRPCHRLKTDHIECLHA